MNFFSELLAQFSKLIGSQSAARRLMALFILAASVSGLVYVMMRAKKGTYKTLYSNLQAADAAEAAGKLRMADIPVQFGENGSTLQVPAGKWDQALMILAQEGLPDSGVPGYDQLMGKSSIGVSDFELKVRYHRSLEGELARTIMTIRGIERARVHLALPKPTLFVKEAPKASASVILKLRSGITLTAKEIHGMVLLVSGAVEGLDPEMVSIIDNRGDLLNEHAGSKDQPSITDRVAYKVQYEDLLKDRIEKMLAKTVGTGKVVAHVNAAFNFSQKTTTAETFDPESKVVRRENWKDESTGGSPKPKDTTGPSGSDTNLPPGNPGSAVPVAPPTDARSKMDRESTYEISKTTSQIVDTVPEIQRLTVSVLVDGKYDEKDDGKGGKSREFASRDAKEIATLEEAVKSVIGFSEERSGGLADVVTVKCVAFQIDETGLGALPPEPKFSPDLIRELIQWGMVGLIGFIVIFTVLRPAVRSVTMAPAAALPAGAAIGALPHGLTGGNALTEGLGEQEIGRRFAETPGIQQPPRSDVTAQLAGTTKQDVPKAARLIRQMLEEKK